MVSEQTKFIYPSSQHREVGYIHKVLNFLPNTRLKKKKKKKKKGEQTKQRRASETNSDMFAKHFTHSEHLARHSLQTQ
jgi:hypothetical protein